MKIALITDLHIGARNDSPVFHNYYEKFYANVFFPYLKKHKIDTAICLGDTFDKRKQINFFSMTRGMEYLFDPLAKNKITLYCLVGNHDAPFKNHIRVSSPKLLFPFYSNITVVDEPLEITLDSKKFLLLPWVCADNIVDSTKAIDTSDAEILCGHLELSGFEMHKGQLSDHGQFEREKFSKFKRVWSGHYHHKSSQGNITYLGNPYELTWSDYNDPRGFHVYDTETDILEFVENPYTMFKKFFYDDDGKDPSWLDDVKFEEFENSFVKVIVTKKTDFLAFDTFIHKLSEANPFEYKVIEDFSEFEDSALDDEQLEVEDTLTLLNAYVDGVSTEVDKERLKKVLRELYVEASAAEK